MEVLPRILTPLVASFLSACATPISVVDQAGKPISGARIEPVSLSINYASVTSDEEGMAAIPWHLQKVEWINVSKKGYQPKRDVEFKHSRLMTVKLRR